MLRRQANRLQKGECGITGSSSTKENSKVKETLNIVKRAVSGVVSTVSLIVICMVLVSIFDSSSQSASCIAWFCGKGGAGGANGDVQPDIAGASVTVSPKANNLLAASESMGSNGAGQCTRQEGFDLDVANHVDFPYVTYSIPFADEEACCRLCAERATCAAAIYDADSKEKCWLIKNYVSEKSDVRRTLLFPPGRRGKKFWD